MQRRFVTVDVFTDKIFCGNPLAVVLDAEDLDDVAMQAIAREFNYSETTFVLPPTDPAHTAHVRIFTPLKELPFAGHPNVGTAYVLAREGGAFGKPLGERLLFEEGAGLVPVDILSEGGTIVGARLTAPRAAEVGRTFTAGYAAVCVGLDAADIVTASHEPVLASAGLPFPVIQLTGLEALRRAKPDVRALAREPDMMGHVYLYARSAEDPRTLHARMFAPGVGVHEDPATGSAAAALTGLLAGLEGADGTFEYYISQGVEMGRPSLMATSADVAGGLVTGVRVGGRCATVMRGEITA